MITVFSISCEVEMAVKKTKKKTVKRRNSKNKSVINRSGYELIFIIISVVSIVSLLSNFNLCGPVGAVLSSFFFGLFGWVNWIFPVYLFFATAFMLANRENGRIIRKIIIAFLTIVVIGGISELISYGDLVTLPWSQLYLNSAKSGNGGGLIGGSVAKLLNIGLANVGAYVILFLLLLLFIIYLSDRLIINLIKGFNVTDKSGIEEDSDLIAIQEERQRIKEERILERRKQKEKRKQILELQRLEREKARAKKLEEIKNTENHEEVLEQYEEDKQLEKIKPSGPAIMQEIIPDNVRETENIEKTGNIEKTEDKGEVVTDEVENTGSVDVKIKEIGTEEKSEISFLRNKNEKKENKNSQFYLEELAKKFGGRLSNFETNSEEKTEEPEKAESVENGEIREEQKKSQISAKNVSFESKTDKKVRESAFKDEQEEEFKPEEKIENTQVSENNDLIMTTDMIEPEISEITAEPTDTLQSRTTEVTTNSLNTVLPENVTEKIEPAEYKFPPTELLDKASGNEEGMSDDALLETAVKLQQTLEAFGVNAEITDISSGPTVTRYELKPEQGVKVSKITALTDDIKLNLAAADIRIEAPIPGKAALGIEVPNAKNLIVYFRELIENKKFTDYDSKLAFAVGKDIAGKVMVSDIAKMPHLLIAGATGSGKSVCINTLIMSVLYKAHPDEVKFIMIDPKVVELSVYNGIPHLLLPVVTDPKKASAALNWAVVEMNRRYKLFAERGVREIKGFNKKVGIDSPEWMPQIIIIVDELADLMMVSSKEVEESICRLAQLARAAGIHLVIATQRPSVNVITGLIKANIPSRIAFAVSSQVDSRTILDGGGAEKLLGKGDMLFFPTGYPQPVRIQGAFVSDGEVSSVVDFIKTNNVGNHRATDITEQVNASAEVDSISEGNDKEEDLYDEYFYDAGKLIIDRDKASIGMLQRVFRIGFNRAARIMDQLYDVGVVGEEEGTKPRRVTMTKEEFLEFIENQKGQKEEV